MEKNTSQPNKLNLGSIISSKQSGIENNALQSGIKISQTNWSELNFHNPTKVELKFHDKRRPQLWYAQRRNCGSCYHVFLQVLLEIDGLILHCSIGR